MSDFAANERKRQYRRIVTTFWAAEYDRSPESVHAVMDLIGSRGVNNTPEGLRVFRGDGSILAAHGDVVFQGANGQIYHLPKERFERIFMGVKP